MASNEQAKLLSKYLDNNCIFLEKNNNEIFSLSMSHGKACLRSNNGMYKVKEIEAKKHKYALKLTCKELGTEVDTIRVFRVKAYKEFKLDS